MCVRVAYTRDLSNEFMADALYRITRTLTLKIVCTCASNWHFRINEGVVKSKASFWRLKTITDFFRMIVNFIRVFFLTMFSMEKSDAYRKGSGSSKKWDGGGGGPGGGKGPYGGGPPRGLDNVRGLNDIRGQNHNSLPACGSCCG